jgi:hypothetical protein
VIEHLTSKRKALSSNPSTAQQNKTNESIPFREGGSAKKCECKLYQILEDSYLINTKTDQLRTKNSFKNITKYLFHYRKKNGFYKKI